MEIVIGKTAGFCFGVENAVSKTKELTNTNKEIFCLGELVHNKQVTDELKEKGVKFIENIEEAKNEVIIRAHGIPKQTYSKAKKLGINLIDLTCPKVLQIHKISEEYSKNRYYIFITGKKEHPEMIGTIGFCEKYYIIEDENDIENAIKEYEKSGLIKALLISQTTYSAQKFEKISNILAQKIKIEIKNTICLTTKQRQEETEKMAKQVDMMIIIGGRHSSNSTKLYDVAKQYCQRTIFAETAEEINKSDFENINKIGIMAGASTPEICITNIVEKIKNIC